MSNYKNYDNLLKLLAKKGLKEGLPLDAILGELTSIYNEHHKVVWDFNNFVQTIYQKVLLLFVLNVAPIHF